jgi:small subunit ribosomal protein S14
MKNLIERDKKRRNLVLKYERKRITLKYTLCNKTLLTSIRWQAGLDLSDLPKNSSKIRLNNRCIITGRGKAVSRAFRLSRIMFRTLVSSGDISGLRKSSW